MKHPYLLALLLGCAAAPAARAQSTAWRPFRPSYTYSFTELATPSGAPHTLRVDSVYATAGGDSVYAFNRVLRNATGSAYALRKSRNNLFGARLRWQPGTHSYYLEANAEPLAGTPAAVSLLLQPRAAVGSSWAAGSGLTATLRSRMLGLVAGTAPDSLATIALSNGQQLVLSQHYGMVSGPQWLALAAPGGAPPATWALAGLPQVGLGFYDPHRLFALQPGAVLGYELEQLAFGGGLTCAAGYRLRRILTRQQTADSLVITYQQQDRVVYSGAPGCANPPGTVLGPVQRGRWAFSLHTGQSPQFPMLPRLSYEYAVSSSTPAGQRLWYNAPLAGGTPGQLLYSGLASTPGQPDVFAPIVDATPMLLFTAGLGATQGEEGLAYTQRYYCPAGSVCPPPAGYAGLLPTRAQQAAAVATLYPNPAPTAATLALAAPAPAGTTISLLDQLGRTCWRTSIQAGQTSVAIAIAPYPPGWYLVQLHLPGQPPAAYPLTH